MRHSRSLIIVCAALCGASFLPQRSGAQEAALTPDLLAPAAGHPAARADTSVVPSGTLSLAQLSGHQPVEGELPQEPIYACACGCGVFAVGTSSMFPHGEGGMFWFEWDYQDQNHNRKGTSSAPAAENDDKELRTDFFTLGLQYFFDRKWGVQVEVPIDHRHFASDVGTFDWTALGDIRIKGIYTGFAEDQSLGVDFGVKLPTGNFTHRGPDRDTEIGTGSTDIVLGGFYRTNLGRHWSFYAQVESDLPVISQDQYRPGFEANGAAGIYYDGFTLHGVKISPLGQVIVSYRTSDTGANSAHPIASGYQRVLLSPGIEFDVHPFTIYGDVEIPVFQYFRGDQIAASALFKVILTYNF